MHVGAAIHAEGDHSTGKPRQPCDDPLVVRVRNQHRRRRRPVEDLGLGVGDRIHGCEKADVRLADVRPHAVFRLGNADERPDFARVIHTQLDDRHIRPAPQFDQRQRQPDVIVEVAAIPDDPVFRGQQLGCQFFGRRLPGAAGDGDDLRPRFPADRASQLLQSIRRVVDFDHDGRVLPRRPVAPGRPAVRNDDAAGAAFDGRVCELRAIKSLAPNREEQLARRDRPRVDGHARELFFPAPFSDPAAGGAHRRRHPSRSQTNVVHTTPEFVRRFASASCATATSSKGRTRSPMTWYFS